MNKRRGFTLIEGMVVMILMVMIMSAIYLMIMYYRDVSGTEQARVRQTQESRFLLSVFSSELKNAGAVMTLTNSGGFLSVPPYFNGIYPLNNTAFPDGIVVANGDPNAVSKLVTAVTPSAGLLDLNNTIATPAWAIGDQGILIGPDGFYVFSVLSVGANSIGMEPTPVYYSGLLDTDNYDDPETVMGDAVSYPAGSPVMRLGEFSIYLVQERYDARKGRNVRELVRVTDCNGDGDVLNPASTATKGVIAENVWDMQLVYTSYPNFPTDVVTRVNYFTNGGSSDLGNLLTALRLKTVKEVTANIVALTDDYPGKGMITYPLPLLADRAATSLPAGKFNYKTYSFLIQPRNYNIKI
jgi:prepilin-type N-terminal cleavage/methylation domain-containing protein